MIQTNQQTETEPCSHYRCNACNDSVFCCRCCGFEHGSAQRKKDYLVLKKMTEEEKHAVTSVFEALGPERVTKGLKACYPGCPIHWDSCFFGEALYPASISTPGDVYIAHVLDIHEREVKNVSMLHTLHQGELKELGEQWLEINRVESPTGELAARPA